MAHPEDDRQPNRIWSEDFYREELILYRWLGLESAFIMDPALIQSVLLEDAGSYSKQPLNDDVFAEAIGGGLLNAEGEAWRWQRRLTAPLFRAEDVLAYIPAFAGACGTVLQRWGEAPPGTSQAIDRNMTRATLQALQDSVLGASLGEADRGSIEQAGGAFLGHSEWKIALTSLRLPPSILHPGSHVMTRAGRTMRDIATRVLGKMREGAGERNDLLGRQETPRPARPCPMLSSSTMS
ncbi:MAG: cytochrome P450 [Methyloceanibacter sp.]